MLELSRHKFASNVCEKALVCADPASRRMLIEELITPKTDGASPIVTMMKDQFASKFIQEIHNIFLTAAFCRLRSSACIGSCGR